MNTQSTNRRQRRLRPLRRPIGPLCRQGISLFEVLISILVAAIGVFGVLVLIPFAVRSAEEGIATESGINAAKNYQADFEAIGYHNPGNWIDDVRSAELIGPLLFGDVVNEALLAPSDGIVAGRPYIIDPLTAVQNQLGVLGEFGQFPNPPGLPTDLPKLNIISLIDPSTSARMELDIARRLTTSDDDLVFKAPAQELEPPRQAYFSAGTIAQAKRQYAGKYSTISFVIPNDDQGNQYRLITVVGGAGDRSNERVFEVIDQNAVSGPADAMRVVRTDTGTIGTRQYEQIAIGGGDVRLSEIPTPGQPPLGKDQIRNSDWIILISHLRIDPNPALEPMHDDIQLSFHRVIASDRETPTELPLVAAAGVNDRGADPERTFSVTLQGSDFSLARDWNAADAAMNLPTEVPTYAILLPNVLAVYERTINTEQLSTWNIAN